jgi:hypothetical protein
MRGAAVVVLAGLSLLACGSSSSSPSSPPGHIVPPPDASLDIPDPGSGNQVDVAFNSVPPNDTPDKATPLGTSTTADVTVWITSNAIGGSSNPANYFVFRSGPSAGQFSFDGCFGPPITSMTAGLWKVADAQLVLPPVATWASVGDSSAGGCLSNAVAALDANTVYVWGLTATGGAGQYSL